MASFPTIENAEIGTVTFLTLGEIQPADRRILPLKRPNVAGAAIRSLARQGKIHRIKAEVDMNTPLVADRQAARDAFMALHGEVVTVTGAQGIVDTGVAILRVEMPQSYRNRSNPAPIETASGGVAGDDATHLYTLFLEVIDTRAE